MRHVFAGDQAEIFVAREFRDIAEALALQENRQRAQHQMQMFGVRDQRQKNQQRQRVGPPERVPRRCFPADGSAARYVIIRMKISTAMMPDSGATLPSQTGRRM